MKILFISLGCDKNLVDSEEMIGLLSKEGFTFTDAGGLQSVYNDQPDMILNIQNHDLPITSNVALLPSSYTLGITGEYERLLNMLSNVDIRQALHYER